MHEDRMRNDPVYRELFGWRLRRARLDAEQRLSDARQALEDELEAREATQGEPDESVN